MKPNTALILTLGVVMIFTFLSAKRYFWLRQNENHDSYLVMSEKCENEMAVYSKCPRLEMWGFKMSLIIFMIGLNLIFTFYLIFRLL